LNIALKHTAEISNVCLQPYWVVFNTMLMTRGIGSTNIFWNFFPQIKQLTLNNFTARKKIK